MISLGRRLIEVEADVGFEVWADNLNALFEEAALAMYEVMVDTSKVEPIEVREIGVKSDQLDLLLHEWLSELLFITDVDGLVFSKFEVNIDGSELLGRAMGEKIDPSKHSPKTEVKAITYYKLKVVKEEDIWRATVVLDI